MQLKIVEAMGPAACVAGHLLNALNYHHQNRGGERGAHRLRSTSARSIRAMEWSEPAFSQVTTVLDGWWWRGDMGIDLIW